MLDASDELLLSDLERRLDARAFRAAARVAVRWQGRKRPQHGAPRLELGTEHPLSALEHAMAAGALESAAVLLERVLANPELLETEGVVAQALAIETLLMLGERERALALATRHTGSLGRAARGAAALELVGLGTPPDTLPDGRPHLLRLSRRLQRSELDAVGLLRLLGTQALAFLRSPELHLLFFSALLASEPLRALRFLNRFLALQGSPSALWRSEALTADNVLARLSFAESTQKPATGPLVSVLVPAHNASATIGYAVDSLLSQSYPALEILVSDDASADDTLEILKRRAASEPRLRLFRSSRNQGPYNSKNALARHARGELITFHDADDLALPDRIARQVEQLEAPGSVACIANFARIRPNGSFVFFKDQRAVRLGMVTLMLRRGAFEAVGPFRAARVGADLELYAALRARFGPAAIARIRSPVMLGLWAPGSATLAGGTESLEDGYRSPARRAYSELVFARYNADPPGLSNAQVDERLLEVGNLIEPAQLLEVS